MSWAENSYRTNHIHTLCREFPKGRVIIFLVDNGSEFNVSVESEYLPTDIRTNLARRIASAIADGPLDDERVKATTDTVLALEGLV